MQWFCVTKEEEHRSVQLKGECRQSGLIPNGNHLQPCVDLLCEVELIVGDK